jgi:hypothetical protein
MIQRILNVETAADIFEEVKVDERKVNMAIERKVPLVMTTYTLPRKVEKYIEKVVTIFLSRIRQENLKDHVAYCVQELIVNAKKANTKRIYFIEKGLDLSDPEDYRTGMETFKEDTLKNITYYLELQKKQGLYIKLIIQITNDGVAFEVRNNVAITDAELIRIYERLIWARKFSSVEDALSHIDYSEGAGLGIIFLVMTMKKLGIGEECFEILKDNRETVAKLFIPPN